MRTSSDERITEIANLLHGMPRPLSYAFGRPKLRPHGEVDAELFMQGLQAQVEVIEASLQVDEELVMTCWHGNERLEVHSVSMPSNNVVALHCTDDEGTSTQVTGHMTALSFSFRVVKTQIPAQRNRIGFEMPSSAIVD